MRLLRDFNKAAKFEAFQTRAFLKRPALATSVPKWEEEQWQSRKDNCYNFALNRQSSDFLQPGAISGCPLPKADLSVPVDKFAEEIIFNALSDGLRFIGGYNFFDLEDNEWPVSLFFNPDRNGYRDFHWFALRNTSVSFIWSHKDGMAAAQQCIESIFNVAGKSGYTYFAGYYAVPQHLAKPEPKKHLLDSYMRVLCQ